MDDLLVRDCKFSRHKVTNQRKVCRIHYHAEYELYYLLDGRTSYFIGDEIYSVKKGDFVFVPKGVLHMTDSETCKYNERLLLSFGEKVFDQRVLPMLEQMGKMRVFCISEKYLPLVDDIWLRIEREYSKRREEQELLVDLYIQELVVLLYRYRNEWEADIRESDKIIYTISEYLSANYEQDITLEKLSRRFGLSQAYLSRKFKAVTGMGISQYLTYVRVTNAENLLRETRLSITEIAERCGFNDSNYFSSVFKKVKDMTPLTYRNAFSSGRPE